jgi:hypothetical protein
MPRASPPPLLGALAGCAVVFIRDTLGPQLGVQIDAVEATAQADADSRRLLGMDAVAPISRTSGWTSESNRQRSKYGA